MISSRPLALSLTLIMLAGSARAASASTWHRDSSHDAYALVQGDHWISSDISSDAVELLRDGDTRNFLWFRRAGRQYRIEDPAVLAQARALFDPLDGLEPEQERLAEQQSALDRRENDLDREDEALDRESDRLDDDQDDDDQDSSPESEADRRALDDKRQSLSDRQRALESESRALDRLERSLDQREDEIERQAEQKLWNLIDEAVRSGAARPITPGK